MAEVATGMRSGFDVKQEMAIGHRPMAEFEACISDGRSRENGKMRAERAGAGD